MKKLSNGISAVSNGFTAMKSAGSILQTVALKVGLLKTAQVEATEATEGETAACRKNSGMTSRWTSTRSG